MKKLLWLTGIVLASSIKADDPKPWLTGPLLTPSGYSVPKGYYNIEPYILANDITGRYDNHWKSHHVPTFWNYSVEVPIQIGLTKKLDILITPSGAYNKTQGVHSIVWNDLFVGFDYQLYLDDQKTWYPAVKFTIEEEFPNGKYKNLNPKKKGTDLGGFGSYGTYFEIVFGKLYAIRHHFLAARLYFGYGIFSTAHVEGLNVYGGDKHTRGKVHPGSYFATLLGLEYTLTQNWVLALDTQYEYDGKSTFSGCTTTPVGAKRTDLISLAPAIEYNFSEGMGLVAGVWFTVAGRNAQDFTNYVIAFNYYGETKKKIKGGEPGRAGGGAGGTK